ncbi:MAG TPA: hypothetical protein DCE55_13860 [Planctomycetaceae bacterium]|nr:hypothetical protein [Planctomycetaceae bacterium]
MTGIETGQSNSFFVGAPVMKRLIGMLPLAALVALGNVNRGDAADVKRAERGPRPGELVRHDSGRRGAEVTWPVRPWPNQTHRLRKDFLVESTKDVQSAELHILGALRAPDGHFSWDRWKWLWFSLNGHQWVRRVEEVPLLRTRGVVNWKKAPWAVVRVPNARFINDGVNELTIWTTNPLKYGEAGKKKFLVVAVDDGNRPGRSYSLVDGKWSNQDLNGDAEGSPSGEWMIRLKLNCLDSDQAAVADALGPARLRQAIADKQEFAWGFTDALHRIFPDRPYTGPIGNTWTLDAARNEYESCQLVVAPIAVDMTMAEVATGDFVQEPPKSAGDSKPPARIRREMITVRLVRTARTGGMNWPDPLPKAYPIDVPRGRVQSWWLTVHVPQETPAGLYHSEVTISSLSTGGRDGKITRIPLRLRVRNFTLPRVSPFQTVGPVQPEMEAWKISTISASGGTVTPRRTLDQEGNLLLDFSEFDKKVEARLAAGQKSFSIGIPYTGAGVFAPWAFDWRVPVQGNDTTRRIYVNPVAREDLDARTPENKQSRKWFEQYMTQFYSHLESKNWTRHWWIYAADEPHQPEWKEPLTRYFAIIRKCAPKLRIMVTREPTDSFGPNLDIACIMMNHLRDDTHKTARSLKQELWCYSCGHLNNPGLTLRESAVDIRTWFWLQEKWNIRRVLLWHASVYGHTFVKPGADGRGDGQVFYFRRRGEEPDEVIPSIRAEMLRDGVEDRDYLFRLKQLVTQTAGHVGKGLTAEVHSRAKTLTGVPAALVHSQYDMSGEVSLLLEQRRHIADAIEALTTVLPGQSASRARGPAKGLSVPDTSARR